MIIRPATLTDTPQLVDILNKIIAIGGTTAYEVPLVPDYFDQLIDCWDPKTFVHVAETKSGIQGLQWVRSLAAPDDHIGSIATFARPNAKQKGIGTALFERTKSHSRQVGFTILVATIRADNSGGITYYEKMGFTDFEITKAVPLKNGTPVDRVSKRLEL